jgi:3-oxoacyl-[acyl-carrier-protein] synthase II
MSQRRVVVTGLGATTPLGGDVDSTWKALIAGQSGVRLLTEDWRELLPVALRCARCDRTCRSNGAR